MDSNLPNGINSMFSQFVATHPKLKRNGEAGAGSEATELAAKPHIIRIDLDVKVLNGIKTLQALKSRGIESNFVIMLILSDSEAEMVAATQADADGYLLKDMEPKDFCVNLQKAVKAMMVLGDNVAENALMEGPDPASLEQLDLTHREREVLDCLGAGLNNKLIGRELGISDSTVKVHIKHLLRKLKLHSRLEAAAWVHEHHGSCVR